MIKRSALEIREHLVKYIKRYDRAVKYVGKDFLTRKGLTLEDYFDFMSVPGNRGDELSLYLAARMCSKQVAVITKNDIRYTGKLNNDEEAFISLDDIDLILVYLGKNVFRATKPKPVLIHQHQNPKSSLHQQKIPTMSPARCTNQNLHSPGGTHNPWGPLPLSLILNQHLRCTLHPNQPLRSQKLIGIDIGSPHKLLLSRKS